MGPTRDEQDRTLLGYPGGVQGTRVALVGCRVGLFRGAHEAGAGIAGRITCLAGR